MRRPRDFLVAFLNWFADGAGSTGASRLSQNRTAAIAPPQPAAEDEDETDYRYRTEREREIELRILMSNWM